jgi:cytochrome c553
MKIGVDPDFPAPYTSAHITTGNAIASNITGAGLPICAKCHQNTNLFNGTVNGNVHNRSNHKGTANGVCNNCHVRTPHAWKRPRLIGYMSDPPPYQSQMVLGIATGNKSPTGWSSGGCGVNGCGSHGTVGAWP